MPLCAGRSDNRYTQLQQLEVMHIVDYLDTIMKNNKQTKKVKIFICYSLYSTSFNLQPHSPPSAQVSIIGSETRLSPRSHPIKKSQTDKEAKKLKIENFRKITTVSTTN